MCYWYRSKPGGLVWSLFYSSLVFILCQLDYVHTVRKGRLMVPSLYTALSGDLHIQLQFGEQISSSLSDLNLEISRLNNNGREKLDTVRLYPDPRYNVTQISIACHNFIKGGIYELEIIDNVNKSLDDSDQIQQQQDQQQQQDERLRQQLDVRWPTPKLSITPELIGTYPAQPVDVLLTFPEVECELKNMNIAGIPEFWLELIYCGQEVFCSDSNQTKSHVLYAEQVRGFPKTRLIKLRCEFFGLAGHYAVQLRPVRPTPSFVSAISYIKADWNEEFVFNVRERSIIPCDVQHGIRVMFEYPACILDKADRVRLFAKLRADVYSLNPPTSLHYVTEQRVIRGQYALNFNCDYFSEKYVEYCFVYVSQAISGAVADIRMDCVPTFPVTDSDSGGWGPWSEWTPCSTTCSGGTRNRYRFCDSPPPRYGAKFCEGSAVETEHCGKEVADDWECLYGADILGSGKAAVERTEISSEIGPGCHCGCIVHLSTSKPRRMIASSAQSCPGRSFWLIQANEGYRVNLKMDFFRLPCSTQYVKIRDGDSLASNMIAEYIGGTKFASNTIASTKSQVLVEFFADELASMGGSCNGGYLAHANQIAFDMQNVTSITSRAITQKPHMGKRFTLVHLVAVIFASIIIIISALLGAQYILRYRKYHLTENRGEADTPLHTPRSSVGSVQNPETPPSRAISTTTLLSEVIYLVKIRPRGRMKHSILRESVDGEALVNETGITDGVESSKCDDTGSISSTHTLTNETTNYDEGNCNDKEIMSSSPNDTESICSRRSTVGSQSNVSLEPSIQKSKLKTVKSNKSAIEAGKRRRLLNVQADDTDTDTDSLKFIKRNSRAISLSNSTLTNGYYSPAASIISTATIRTTNQKESKEKQNREKLLARPDSEFSLANPEDLELDYYDYNVINAGAAPGSYLGMDPAYLVWIPPLDEGNIINEVEDEEKDPEPYYEEILPRHGGIDPGSNTETPDDDDQPPEPPPLNYTPKHISPKNDLIESTLIHRTIVEAIFKEDSPKFEKRQNSETSNKSNLQTYSEGIPLQEFNDRSNRHTSSSPIKTNSRKSCDAEKETSVVKSPSDNLQNYYELDDIQFADEDDSGESDTSKSKTIAYNRNFQCKT